MSDIHILAEDGNQTVYTEEQVARLRANGELTSETFYWKEGMTGWRPLKELSAPLPPAKSIVPPRRSPSPNPAPQPRRDVLEPASPPSTERVLRPKWQNKFDDSVEEVPAKYALRSSLQPYATIVLVLLGLCFVTGALCLYVDIRQYQMLHLDFTLADSQANDLHVRVFSLVNLGVYTFTWIFFLIWMYRAYRNCRAFVTDMSFTAGWAVGSFFMPVANLCCPCLAMQEIWKVSSNPKRRRMQKTSALVGVWWVMWLLTCLLSQLAWVMTFLSHQREELIEMTTVYLAFRISYLPLCIVTFIMVWMVTQKQRQASGAED